MDEVFLDNLLNDIHAKAPPLGKNLELNASSLPLGGTTDTQALAGAIGALVRMNYIERVEKTDMFPCHVHLTILGIRHLRSLDDEKVRAAASRKEAEQSALDGEKEAGNKKREQHAKTKRIMVNSTLTLLVCCGVYLLRKQINSLDQPVPAWLVSSALATCVVGFVWHQSQRLVWFLGGIIVCVVGLAPLLIKAPHPDPNKTSASKSVIVSPVKAGKISPPIHKLVFRKVNNTPSTNSKPTRLKKH